MYSDTLAESLNNLGFNIELTETPTTEEETFVTPGGKGGTKTTETMNITFGTKEGITFFGSDTISFWSDVTNKDSLKIKKGGVVLFYGETWKNVNASISNEGLLCMSSPRPAPYTANFKQVLDNGGKASAFPLLVIDNPNNVEMANDMEVNDTLIFKQGKLLLNGHNLIVKNSHKDAIQGYTEDSYVVTGSGATGGYLIRYGVGKETIDYPVGPTTSSYTPASIRNKGTVDNFSVRAFEGVYESGDSGRTMDDYGVGTTWDIKEDSAGGSKLTLTLQHNEKDEGTSFDADHQYVAKYVGTKNNSDGDTVSGSAWDLVYKSFTGPGSSSGTITSGSAVSKAVVTSRSGITELGLFTKAGYTSAGALPVKLLYFRATAKGDYNVLKWATSMELNNYYFTLERSRDGTRFEEMGTRAGAGNTFNMTDYLYEDLRPYDITYYRLSQTDYDGTTEVLGVQIVRRDEIQAAELLVYPNPCTQSNLFVELSDESDPGSFVQIIDLSGRIILNESTAYMDEGEIITFNVSELPRGIYLVQRGNKGTLTTKKLIIPEGR